jgi:hypothetical protein
LNVQRLQVFLALLYRRHVELDVDVVHLASGTQLARLHEGDLDLGLVHGIGPGDGIATEPVYHGEPIATVVSLAHRISARRIAQLADLAGDVLLVVPERAEPVIHSRVLDLAESSGVPFRDVREAPGPDLRDLLFAVASDRGVAFAPESALGTVGELGDALTAHSVGLARRMPDTCLAFGHDSRPELGEVGASAREVARQLYAASNGWA